MNETNESEMINDEILSQIENVVLEDESLEMSNAESDVETSNALFPSDHDLEYPVVKMESESLEDFENSLDLDVDDEDQYQEQEDKLWQARTGLNVETLCGAIETIIFMSDRPVPLAKIRNLIDEDLPLRVVHSSLERLQNEYELKHHGIRLQEVAEGYQFRTKATFSKYVQDLFKVNSLVLSPTALEVLAIIAYKQPVSRIEIEKIRGVDSSHIVRGLMDKRLVRVTGRSNEAGRPVLYGTTTEFLEVFNLANLDQLPPEHELEEMSQQEIGKISDIKTIVHNGDKQRFSFDEIDELDALAERIRSIDSETDFTRSLKLEEKKRKSEDGEVIKSAFDLLEEHLDNRLVSEANEDSLASEVFTAITDPQVIRDLTAGPFNMPEIIEEDEDDFQMIDLDTGEVITDELEDDGSVADPNEIIELDDDYDMLVDIEMSDEEIQEISKATGLPILPADEEEEISEVVAVDEDTIAAKANETAENLFSDDKDEMSSLAAALDAAFANLTGSSLDDSDFEESGASVQDKSNDIDNLTSAISEKAKDLDLDLSFLNDDSSTKHE